MKVADAIAYLTPIYDSCQVSGYKKALGAVIEAAKAAQDQPQKCSFPPGIAVKPDGINDLDPCIYEEVERYRNVTIAVMSCQHCGHTEVTWYRQEDTEKVEDDDE